MVFSIRDRCYDSPHQPDRYPGVHNSVMTGDHVKFSQVGKAGNSAPQDIYVFESSWTGVQINRGFRDVVRHVIMH